MKNLILLLTIILLGGLNNFAQTADKLHTPTKGSAERAAILDAIRDGGQDVIYQVYYLKVHNGWAWIDATPLDAKTKRATAEGGTNLLHLENGKWRVMDLSSVPEDPDNPMASQDASAVFVRNLRKTFAGCPADIFFKPRH